MATAAEIVISGLLLAAPMWMLLGSVGMIRLGDVYMRLHAAGLASTLGLSVILIASLLYFGVYHGTGAKLVVAWLLSFMLSPISTHLMARAAYRAGIQPQAGYRDDLARAAAREARTRKVVK